MTSPWVRSTLKTYFLPDGNILISWLFEHSSAVQIIKENFSFALTAVNVNFVAYQTA